MGEGSEAVTDALNKLAETASDPSPRFKKPGFERKRFYPGVAASAVTMETLLGRKPNALS